MSRSRLLILIASLVLALSLLLWLLDSISQLYFRIAAASPLLGNFFLLLIAAMIALLIGLLIYYVILFRRPARSSGLPAVQVSEDKAEAAQEQLQAVQQQVSQIQDEVARQALMERSQAILASLDRGELRVVIFGIGSSGKTSIINAMMGRIAGAVGAPMGTTTIGQTYRFRLKNLAREIHITDTPGILEAGILGTDREQLARQLATEADLLLFVLDNDLRKTEYEALRQLIAIGKRTLVVFNKTDLFPDADRQAILDRLQSRLQTLLNPEDIIAIAANPQPVLLDDQQWFTPDPDIVPLLRRVALILRAEGEDLIADNILLQSRQLGEDARRLMDAERQRQADKVIDRFQWITAGVVSVTPLPVVDLLATAAINAQMVVEIGKIYGCEINLERGKELALSLAKTLVSLGVVRGAIELFSIALQTNVGTFLIGRAIQGATAAYLTRIAGKSFIQYFQQNQDWGDGGVTAVVQQQFRLNQRDEFIRSFVQDTLRTIAKVEPKA